LWRSRCGSPSERQTVVFGQVARHGARLAERLFDATRGLLGDVLVERARRRAHGQDTLHGSSIEGTEGGGVTEREVDVFGRNSSAGIERDDAPRAERLAS
jgi:hypothetical protein